MKAITLALLLCLLLTIQTVFAAEPKLTGNEGMSIAEEILLGKKLPEDHSEKSLENGGLKDAEDYFRDLRTAAALAQPGSLAFEMETVEILSDASNDISEPVAPPETAPANKPE